MGSVTRKVTGQVVSRGTKMSAVKMAAMLPQMPRKARKRAKIDQKLAKLANTKSLLGRFGESDPSLTSAELERLHQNMSQRNGRGNVSGLLGMIERAELKLYSDRAQRKEWLSLRELERFRQVATWQLEGEDREQLLAGVSMMIAAQKRV